jgi:hypothetical protein
MRAPERSGLETEYKNHKIGGGMIGNGKDEEIQIV